MSSRVTSGPLSQQEGKKKKVLFVDNEPDTTTMLKMALECVGFSIDTFNDPLLALKSFKPNLYDLVMLDVMMPKMNGFELYEQLKRADPGTKVCFLTASDETYREELRKERYCELNRDLFLEMPLPIKEIIDEIMKRIE
jgi:two-component system, OmpR family, response regulator ChvI